MVLFVELLALNDQLESGALGHAIHHGELPTIYVDYRKHWGRKNSHMLYITNLGLSKIKDQGPDCCHSMFSGHWEVSYAKINNWSRTMRIISPFCHGSELNHQRHCRSLRHFHFVPAS